MEPDRFPGMLRSLEQWAKMNPEAVLQGSDAQVRYALADAKHDIAALARLLYRTMEPDNAD